MTEQEWLACTDPEQMLDFLRGKASKRQECLFGVACCLRVAHLFEGRLFWALADGEPYLPRPGVFIEMTERRAEQPASLRLGEYGEGCPYGYADEGHATFAADAALYSANAERASTYAASAAAVTSAGLEEDYGLVGVARTLPGYAVERAAQADLLRCILGNPFRPVTVSPAWRTPQVIALAQAAYDQRELPAGTLDVARLAVLADALEEAGCDQADLLAHLRGPGPHVRGCWAVDLLLGKS
jgi:hypothetical protein